MYLSFIYIYISFMTPMLIRFSWAFLSVRPQRHYLPSGPGVGETRAASTWRDAGHLGGSGMGGWGDGGMGEGVGETSISFWKSSVDVWWNSIWSAEIQGWDWKTGNRSWLETAMLIFFLEFTKNPALRSHSEDWLLVLPCCDPKRWVVYFEFISAEWLM